MRGWLGLMALVLVAPAAAADPACEVAMGPLCATFPDNADDVREATEAALCSLAPCPGACDPGDYEGCGLQPEVPLPTDVATACGLVLPTCHVDCGPPWPPEPKVEDRRLECRRA